MMAAKQDLRKGWCPGALRPMKARDGLLVRLRLTGGILPAATALSLAELAQTHGNGLFDLSARANLQMRGVGGATLPALLDGLRALGVLDDDPEAEAVRNVLASPLAGFGPGPDIRPIVAALETRLSGDPELHALPGKFGFLIDDGDAPTLAGIAADVRFDWVAETGGFAVALGGSAADALPLGVCAGTDVAARAVQVARGFLSSALAHPDVRRMRTLRDRAGDAAVAEACGGAFAPAGALPRRLFTQPPNVVGLRTFGGVPVLGLAAPFGRLNAAMLRDAAALARELRLTPWRTILAPFSGSAAACGNAAGFITDPADPRLRVAACTGRDGCDRGTTDTYADAAALADLALALGRGVALHVSGCAKGCVKPSVSAVTLVGRDGTYDLVRRGRPGDPADERGLDLPACRAALAAAALP